MSAFGLHANDSKYCNLRACDFYSSSVIFNCPVMWSGFVERFTVFEISLDVSRNDYWLLNSNCFIWAEGDFRYFGFTSVVTRLIYGVEKYINIAYVLRILWNDVINGVRGLSSLRRRGCKYYTFSPLCRNWTLIFRLITLNLSVKNCSVY